ncbi:MAG: hypothetical protein HY986_20675 [Candidatus Melainabacteria bacterium]|nr:hypothetical protein [Candidatus Melainabacteria bacterium]
MLVDIIRAILERVLRDKLLLGLIIIGILGIFVTGANKDPGKDRLVSNQEEEATNSGQKPGQHQGQAGAGQGQRPGGQPQPAQGGPSPPAETPQQTASIACEFIKWWLTKAMDYQQTTAVAAHKEALSWMKPPATEAFVQLFWSDELAAQVESGARTGSFQTSMVSPLAVNPDGSIPIRAIGVLVLQDTGYPPKSQPLELNFLVKKEAQGYRIVNFYSQAGEISYPGGVR